MAKRWKTITYRDSRHDGHMLPIRDLRRHVERRSCWCKPSLDLQENGSAIVVHNALDGRELVERYGLQ